MKRRKFIAYLSSGTFIFTTYYLLSNLKNKKISFDINDEQRKFIRTYNKSRLNSLKNNFFSEVKKDLLNNKTLWVGKNIYTYAEFYKN